MHGFLSSLDWNPSIAHKLLFDCALGLTFLHSKGILHSDIKAENMMVDLIERGEAPKAERGG